MAKCKIDLKLSSKVQKETGYSEILLRLTSNKINLRCKTEVFISPKYFEYFIDLKKTIQAGSVYLPNNTMTCTLSDAGHKGYILKDSGIMVIKSRISTPEVIYHKDASQRIEDLTRAVAIAFEKSDISDVHGDWLKIVVDKYNHPDKYVKKEEKSLTFYELMDLYLEKKNFSYDHTKAIHVLIRDVARYELFIRYTDKRRKDFTFDVNTMKKDDIEDFLDYLRNEKDLSEEYPQIFNKILKEFPVGIGHSHKSLEVRGENTIIKLAKKLKAFFVWLYDTDKTRNRPFNGIVIGSEKFGTPYYITIEERNRIANYDFANNKHLERQKDIFVFHCFVGCRVSDLIKLTESNITDGILVYTPHKTKDEGSLVMQARVPLHDTAKKLIEKYKGVDSKGRLFPFISPQKYNNAIKEIFTEVGITRNVEVRNAQTGENKLRPINEIASSHLARRTFVGNAYLKVSDPNIIGKMSGHVEGSKAFSRYRKIEDETLSNVIDLIG